MVLWQQCFKGSLSVKTNYIVANVAVTPPDINWTDTNARTSCLPFVVQHQRCTTCSVLRYPLHDNTHTHTRTHRAALGPILRL